MDIGIDMVELSRMRKSIQIPGFIEKVFSPEEIELYRRRKNSIDVLSGRFCAKEAFVKAIGTGIKNFELNEISTLTDESGKPYMTVSENIRNIIGEKQISVSITHTNEYAAASVVVY